MAILLGGSRQPCKTPIFKRTTTTSRILYSFTSHLNFSCKPVVLEKSSKKKYRILGANAVQFVPAFEEAYIWPSESADEPSSLTAITPLQAISAPIESSGSTAKRAISSRLSGKPLRFAAKLLRGWKFAFHRAVGPTRSSLIQ